MVIVLIWHGTRGGYGSGWPNGGLLLNHAEMLPICASLCQPARRKTEVSLSQRLIAPDPPG
jgi:hypothetical protein